jgi:hypothetical protein
MDTENRFLFGYHWVFVHVLTIEIPIKTYLRNFATNLIWLYSWLAIIIHSIQYPLIIGILH